MQSKKNQPTNQKDKTPKTDKIPQIPSKMNKEMVSGKKHVNTEMFLNFV